MGSADNGALDGFRFWLLAKSLSRRTVGQYTFNVQHWLAWCCEHEIDCCGATRDTVIYYLGTFAETHKQSYVMLRLLMLRYYFDFLIEQGEADENPARSIKYRQAEAQPAEPLTVDELQRMYDGCETYREQAIFLLFVGAGLRRNEIYGLRRHHVNFDAGTIEIFGKGAHYRHVAPGHQAIEALRLAFRLADELCPFATDDYVWRTIRKVAKRAGIRGRVYPHRFRHTFATMFLDRGGNVDELQIILGHRRIEQSIYYSRANRENRALARQSQINIVESVLS